MEENIRQLCHRLGLGKLTCQPTQVTGGLLHNMYHVITEKGEYAVKVLNPDIMKRKEALGNMISSEIIANKMKQRISVVAAIEFEGKYVIKWKEDYFIIYDWIHGKSLFGEDIKVSHCVAIGSSLAEIHAMNLEMEQIEKEINIRDVYNWNFYLQEAKKQNVTWMKLYEENMERIIEWDNKTVESLKILQDTQVISHRDLDPKNVLWDEEKMYIIDWEAAGYINPYQELVEVLNYWTVDSTGEYDRDKLNGLLSAYIRKQSIEDVDWSTVLNGSFDGMLGWLEYNMKRALEMENSNKENINAGTEQLVGTINELNHYEQRISLLKYRLNEYVTG